MITVRQVSHTYGVEAMLLPSFPNSIGLAWHDLACAPWADEYPYRPTVSFAVAHTGTAIMLAWRVTEDGVRAEARHDGDAVWEDSCCECFIQFPQLSDHYYNIEANCAGQLLVGCGTGRHDRQMASTEVMAAISRHASLGRRPFPLREGFAEWQLSLVIPTTTFFRDHIGRLDGLQARANFYKCGDRLSRPHFLSFYPIALPRPDFHCPPYFGELQFE